MSLPDKSAEQNEDEQKFQDERVVLTVLHAVPPPDHRAPLELIVSQQPPEQKPARNLPENSQITAVSPAGSFQPNQIKRIE